MYYKIILLFFVCMYSVDFISHWAGRYSWRSYLIPVVSSPSVGENIPRGPTRVVAANLCVMCFICYDKVVCVLVFPSVLGGAVLPVAVERSPWFPICGG